jgi:alkaline phosphatase D
MTLLLDRRLLLKAASLGLGALAVPGVAQMASARGFTHGVASGEPRQRSVMLWTRYVPGGRIHWQVSRSEDFRRIVDEGDVFADAERDLCVKPVATGLRPGQHYFYRFRDGRGGMSDVGRTRTLPEGRTQRFNLGIFSCANLAFGFFNAYGHAADRDDIDLAVHLGDYYYEYPHGTYPIARNALPGRFHPESEAVHLADYRLRHALYRADPDLQRLHARAPMVLMWDDHETANNSWEGGAENHDPAKEGAWSARKKAAMRAYREWLPVSDRDWESYEIGDLASLFRVDTRLAGRSRMRNYDEILMGRDDVKATLTRFRDGAWRDQAMTMMGSGQEAWLAGSLKRSARQGTRWQLLAQQTLMGSCTLPLEAKNWVRPEAPAIVQRATANAVAASEVGLPLNLDAWDGYPAARDRLLRSALDADSNLLVLTGDSHNGWAYDLDLGGAPAGVEFAGQSVTSPGLEGYATAAAPADVERGFRARNPALKWMDASRRGYLTLSLTPDRATGEWLSLDTVRTRSTKIAATQRMSVTRGSRKFG